MSDGKSESNEIEAYPSSLDEAKRRNRKIIEVSNFQISLSDDD